MRAENLYHILHFIPATQAWELPPALERAALAIVRSGRLRINADAYRNFVRHGTADADLTFTARELTDAALLPRTRQVLQRLVAPASGADGIDEVLQRLRRDLTKARGVDEEKERKVARVLAQSCHPVVLQLLIESGAEIFVSYAHNVGDLMAVHDWQGHGTASGLQATDERALQVYISCGGDPFFEGEQKTYVTDGFPALARMIVIGAQEIGHFSDLARDGQRILGRYSTSPAALAGRRADLANLAHWHATDARRIARLKRREDALAFYDKRSKFSPFWFFAQLRRAIAWVGFALAPRPDGLPLRFATYPRLRAATATDAFLADMAFNLAPQADVYRHPDPAVEEEIACIEAVARVPQQVMKWGHNAVSAAWPALYRLYYGPIVASCRAALNGPVPEHKMAIIQWVSVALRRLVRKRPDFAAG